mgnify:CR=1 FL=1
MFVPAPEIFKAYDIRGIVDKTLTVEAVRAIGHALGSEAVARNQKAIAVGRDGRLSGPALAGALADGIRAAGVDVIDVGCVPTPLTYFAAYELGTNSCVSVTGSHNPPDYNGLKMVLGGQTLFGELIQALRQRIIDGNLVTAATPGKLTQADVVPAYIEKIVGDVKLSRPMKVVMDCGNGVAGAVAPELFKRLGCELVELFCEVDGNFPNHHPDPGKPENLEDLIARVKSEGADLGLAFDGDGDRVGVVTNEGEMIFPDRLLMLFARDVLSRNPGADVIFDVKCTRGLASLISGGFSPARAIGMTLIGGLLYALEIHTWFGWLAKRYPEPASPGQRWQRAALAWCWFNPLWIARHALFIRLLGGRTNEIDFSLLTIGATSFALNMPVALAANYLIQNRLALRWQVMASAGFSAIMAVYYAMSEVWFG